MELPSLINESEETEKTKPTEPEQGSSLRQESISQELRKHLHIKSEQRRRSKIIDGFQKLRNIIPLVKPQTDSKAQVLKKATEYIEELQYQNNALAANCEMLKEYSHQLHTQLLQLNATPVMPAPQLHRVYSQEVGHTPPAPQTQIQYPPYPGVFAPPMGHSHSEGRIMPYPAHLAPPPPVGFTHIQSPYPRRSAHSSPTLHHNPPPGQDGPRAEAWLVSEACAVFSSQWLRKNVRETHNLKIATRSHNASDSDGPVLAAHPSQPVHHRLLASAGFPARVFRPCETCPAPSVEKKHAPGLVSKYFRSAFICAISKLRIFFEHSGQLQARITSLWQGLLQSL
ncbi:hypothetical protein KL930_004424 [Ogataea haglerorum]|uniref:BHLH domain-containing protein n=1 Tax=Ogataea haglerorum TaxID=1937702 RepID=A0AAN6D2J1_9ASCO|nr:hypothetical protein KL915_004639 [Ogataea haglerorum]KAG7703897.1 hypothetical protein KL914_004388 [Ogataea haglerorum]KAG7715517.1 hypothetical protein KL913_003852 [Ogataea haglerorum]KAG7716039.1 hypothetical protein KL949_003934 [Ogataea haglerorum]KAG7725320.1 hypothetical protein KL933_004334 [Ogataea haglerorum]